jgi:hypothetical protein
VDQLRRKTQTWMHATYSERRDGRHSHMLMIMNPLPRLANAYAIVLIHRAHLEAEERGESRSIEA